jgi:hypothetical protein
MLVEQLEQWIGAEVVDPSGVELGKLSEVYYDGQGPVLITIKGSLLSRKRRIAPLQDASVSRHHVRVAYAADRLIDSDSPGDDLDAADMTAASEQYGTVIGEEGLEPSAIRAERLRLEAEAEAHASALEADARQRAVEAETAAARAHAAQRNADTAADLNQRTQAEAEIARSQAPSTSAATSRPAEPPPTEPGAGS